MIICLDVATDFEGFKNPLMTILSVPMLQYVGGNFYICQNSPSFVVPANLHTLWSGHMCAVANGTGNCPTTNTTCPA